MNMPRYDARAKSLLLTATTPQPAIEQASFMAIIRHGYASREVQATRVTAHWQRIRQERLMLDGYQCQLQYDGCQGTANTVHLDASANGDHTQATLLNTLSACRRCHSKRGGL